MPRLHTRMARLLGGLLLCGATAALADASPPPGRLSDLATPTAYRLDLHIDPRQTDFGGEVQVDIALARDSDVIWLHGKDLDVSHAEAIGADGRRHPARYRQELDSGVASLRFDRALAAGDVTLVIAYRAAFDRTLAGLFRVEEQGDAYALAKSESIQARRFLPGFDEPGLKAPYTLRLTVPAGYAVIGNSPEVRREPAGDGLETVHLATTRPMPTYLLSLAVGPFDVVERPPLPPNAVRKQPLPLRGFARRGRGGDLNYILDITPRMLEIFETGLQRPYPFAKLDIVAAPQWPSGATELSAAITYREQIILVGDDPPPGARLSLVNIHAHELAHMWFGNLVTPPWWDDLWLKEGFATWGTPFAMIAMEPAGGHALTAATRAIAAMEIDALASTRSIREPIDRNEDIRNAYDPITYGKSLGVIHMVDQYFGPELFRPALGRYVAHFADGTADAAQFYAVIARETGTPAVADTFRSFVEQPGVPLLRVSLAPGDGACSASVDQQRYRPLGSPIADSGQRWTVPMCLATSDGNRHCGMVAGPRDTLQFPGTCPDWVLPNAGGAGYYRFDLPGDQWLALLAAFDRHDALEQLAIIDSAFATFEAGALAAPLLWEVIAHSSAAAERQVVTAPFSRLARYREQYFDAAQREAFAARMLALYGARLRALAGSDDPDQQLLRSELISFLALDARVPVARAELRSRAIAFTGFGFERDPTALVSDLYTAALQVAVQDLGKPFVEHLVTVRTAIDDPRFEAASARALGDIEDPALLPALQALALDEAMAPREAFYLLLTLGNNPVTRQAHWQWLQANFPAVMTKIPAQWRRQSPLFAGRFCDAAGDAMLRDLFAHYGALAPGYERSLAQTTEQIGLCQAQRPLGEALGALLASPAA